MEPCLVAIRRGGEKKGALMGMDFDGERMLRGRRRKESKGGIGGVTRLILKVKEGRVGG